MDEPGSPRLQSALPAHIPHHSTLVVRFMKDVSQEQREEALKATEYNVFSFPAALLFVDFLSDSGTTAMTDLQWSSLFHGDEAYGRNKDAVRDTFERGDNQRKAVKLVLTDEDDVDLLMKELYLAEHEGGFVNGGKHQLIRPNTFLVPQGRCAEFLLFSTIAEVLMERWRKQNKKAELTPKWFIPSNGHFDTTAANIYATKVMQPVNLFDGDQVLAGFKGDVEKENPFKGNMNIDQLRNFLTIHRESVPLIFLTITNNTACGQPVSLANMKAVRTLADEFDIPLFFDACRFAENAFFIQQYEEGQQHRSLHNIVQECFSYADGFTISFKKDGLANIGGGLFFRDGGRFQKQFSDGDVNGPTNIGVRLKEKQILTFGNDSYGALSGRDIISVAVGLYEVLKPTYLASRVGQTQEFALKLHRARVPVVLPPGGHAVYLDMTRFFAGLEDSEGNEVMKLEDFGGVGLTIELIRRYGIRACELGPFAFEWDQKTEDERRGVLNVVRLAIPRNAYSSEHIDYSVQALSEMYKHRDHIPKMRIARGETLRLRHFQSGLVPVYHHHHQEKH